MTSVKSRNISAPIHCPISPRPGFQQLASKIFLTGLTNELTPLLRFDNTICYADAMEPHRALHGIFEARSANKQ